MRTNEKAEAMNFGPKTQSTGGAFEAFSTSDSTTGLEQVGSIIKKMMRPGKVFRLVRCFACNRYFPASRMSNCLAVCRECSKRTHGKGRIARRSEIDRITNAIRIFLRARLEAK